MPVELTHCTRFGTQHFGAVARRMALPDLQLSEPDPRMARKTMRHRITLVHNQVMDNYFDQSTLPSLRNLDQWFKQLRVLDAIIKDEGSEAYIAKIIQICNKIQTQRAKMEQYFGSDSCSASATTPSISIRDIGSQLSFQSSLSVSNRTPPVGTPQPLPSWNHVQPPVAGPQPMNHFPVQSADVDNPYLPHQQWSGQYTSAYQQPHQQWTGQPRQQPHYQQQSAFPVVDQPQVHPMHSFNQQWYLQPPMPAHQFPQYTGGQQFVPQPFMAPSYPWNEASMTVPMTIVQKEVELIPFDGVPGHYQQFERLFDAVYGTNPAYTDSQKFLLFHKYVGAVGRPFLESIDPIDPMGLVYAKGQMRQHFNDPFRVRAQVKAKIDALPVTKSARQTAVLEKNLVVCEGALRDLMHSGATEEFINQVLYEHIAAKLPWPLVNSYGKSNFIKTVSGLLQHARCDLQNAKETNARTGDLDTDDSPPSNENKTEKQDEQENLIVATSTNTDMTHYVSYNLTSMVVEENPETKKITPPKSTKHGQKFEPKHLDDSSSKNVSIIDADNSAGLNQKVKTNEDLDENPEPNSFNDDDQLTLSNKLEEKHKCIKERTFEPVRFREEDFCKWGSKVATLDADLAPEEPAVTDGLGSYFETTEVGFYHKPKKKRNHWSKPSLQC